MPAIELTKASTITARVEAILAIIKPQISALLPDADIEHIGATAIPEAITKGDLDMMVRVTSKDFAVAIGRLKTLFPIKQPENWNNSFASFGDDHAYPLPLGIQLVVKDSESDFFVYIREHLIRNPAALRRYNELKQHHAPNGSEAYWQAKHLFFSEILATRSP